MKWFSSILNQQIQVVKSAKITLTMYKNINKAEINFSNFQALKVSHFKLHNEKNAEYCLFIQIKFITYLGSVHVIT